MFNNIRLYFLERVIPHVNQAPQRLRMPAKVIINGEPPAGNSKLLKALEEWKVFAWVLCFT